MFNASNPIKITGVRRSAKLFETLVPREEMAKVEDLGGCYRVPADNRNLNYNRYFVDGEQKISDIDDYGDTNTCLAVIAAKRRKIPVFHMEAGN